MSGIGQSTNTPIINSQLAQVHFVLAPNITFTEQVQRGEIWVVIRNQGSNAQFCTTPYVRDIVQLFRQKHTLKDVLTMMPEANRLGTDEWLNLLSHLIQSDILQAPELSDDQRKFELFNKNKSAQWRQQLSRPWMFKFPLGNPNTLLQRIDSHCRWLWHPVFFVAWIATLLPAVILALDHSAGLQHFWQTRFLDPSNIMLALAIYPLLKLIHEFGHGLAARHWGAEVVETGILFIFFVPLPYIDVSQSSAFSDKRHRIIVALAGMALELFVAALALYVWVNSDTIWIRDICLNIMLIGAITTVLFNANPLLKFDGYYVLSDILEMPNLSQRAAAVFKSHVLRALFKIQLDPPAYSLKEYRILLWYGFLAQCYRWFVCIVITLFLGSHYFTFGIILAVWLLLAQLIWPIAKQLIEVFKLAKLQNKLLRAGLISGAMTSVALLFIFVVPFHQQTLLKGILVVDGKAQINANTSGFIRERLVQPSDPVNVGQPLLVLENNSLKADLYFLAAKVEELKFLSYQYTTQNPAQAEYYKNQQEAFRQEYENLADQQKSLVVRAPVAGRFVTQNPQPLEGQYVHKGDPLGYILASEHIEILAVAQENQTRKLNQFSQAELCFDEQPQARLKIAEITTTPAAIEQLPSPYLGTRYGGSVAVNSLAKDGLQLLQPMFQLQIRLQSVVERPFIGSRVTIKITHGQQTLASSFRLWFYQKLQQKGILSKF